MCSLLHEEMQGLNRGNITQQKTKNPTGKWLGKQEKVARVTGLEPATSGVTGRRSNQLSYTPAIYRTLRPAVRMV